MFPFTKKKMVSYSPTFFEGIPTLLKLLSLETLRAKSLRLFLISPPCDPNSGEALANILVANLANSFQLKDIILEEDSQVVTLALQHPHTTQSSQIAPTTIPHFSS
jgi:hypothetical protein